MTTQPPIPPTSPDQPGANAVPTCFRHPDRETYVRCQRCERPICPDCMREAAVGHQCVECVREGGRTIRQAKAVFGGQAVAVPRVTYALLALNLVAYVIETFFTVQVIGYFAMDSASVAVNGEWYRLITSAFLHLPLTSGGLALTHILFNMWALWVIGPELERRLGSARFAALYLASALGGSVAIYLLGVGAVGASGAIYGLFGALFVVGRRLGYDVRGVLWLIGINVAITFLLGSIISWQGHLGGLVTGGLVAAVLAYAPSKNRGLVQWAGIAVIVAVLLLTVAIFPPFAALGMF
ncbi:rhomboid family intramembrane serine protease [Spongiactinospora sp. TRM90649]|uniref:rhomboid family intramembrane serine protease n=1 Tax=Spongiactinospora sp. TRM90649 TaxID=3031114 RepID=UPI0023F6E834|nr:rhomboid family intramembrane serine protease [Spongiactinospora sp. TRM90649]MDF5752973.1 rhomboid family intramembrane serine protease [Spongiactinospora sp. TRM90649]